MAVYGQDISHCRFEVPTKEELTDVVSKIPPQPNLLVNGEFWAGVINRANASPYTSSGSNWNTCVFDGWGMYGALTATIGDVAIILKSGTSSSGCFYTYIPELPIGKYNLHVNTSDECEVIIVKQSSSSNTPTISKIGTVNATSQDVIFNNLANLNCRAIGLRVKANKSCLIKEIKLEVGESYTGRYTPNKRVQEHLCNSTYFIDTLLYKQAVRTTATATNIQVFIPMPIKLNGWAWSVKFTSTEPLLTWVSASGKETQLEAPSISISNVYESGVMLNITSSKSVSETGQLGYFKGSGLNIVITTTI